MKKFLIFLFLTNFSFAQEDDGTPWVSYNSFANLRNEVLAIMSKAQDRIILYTDHLSDGEIATGLFIAQYRKVAVDVILGPAKSKMFTSRLGYLKSQNIPTVVKPSHIKTSEPTILLSDNEIFVIDSELNVAATHNVFKVRRVSQKEHTQLFSTLTQMISKGLNVRPTTLPPAGAPYKPLRRKSDEAYSPEKNEGKIIPQSRLSNPNPELDDDTFQYSRDYAPRPIESPDKLPKVPLWKKKQN